MLEYLFERKCLGIVKSEVKSGGSNLKNDLDLQLILKGHRNVKDISTGL